MLKLNEENGDLILKNKYGIFSKKEMEYQLKEGHFTFKELGNLYQLKPYQIKHLLSSLGIVEYNDVNDIRIYNPEISPSLHQMLLGTMLGDGSLRPKMYIMGHGINQCKYCYHIAERLGEFISTFGDKNTGGSTEKSFYFNTYSHSVFTPYFKKFYSRGKKKKYLTYEAVYELGPEGLAYWFMDDGKYNEYGFYLCTGNIDPINEGEMLVKVLRGNFSINSNVQIANEKNKYYNIYINANSRSHFLELISPYVIDSMKYKLDGSKQEKFLFSKENIFPLHLHLCEISNRYINYSGDKDIENMVKQNIKILSKKDVFANSILNAIKNNEQISIPRKPIDNEKIKNLLKNGLGDSEIAELFNINRNTVGKIRRNLGFSKKSVRKVLQKEDKLKELFSDPKMTIQKAMKKLNISYYKVKNWINNYENNKLAPLQFDFIFRKALLEDLNSIKDLLFSVVHNMNKNGLFMWNKNYPNQKIIKEDIKKGNLFVITFNEKIIGMVVLNNKLSKSKNRNIKPSNKSLYVHRLCVHPDFQKRGLSFDILNLVEKRGYYTGFSSIRAEVTPVNIASYKLFISHNYVKNGTVEFSSGVFDILEKELIESPSQKNRNNLIDKTV